MEISSVLREFGVRCACRIKLVAMMLGMAMLLPVIAAKVTPQMAAEAASSWGRDNQSAFGVDGNAVSAAPAYSDDGALLWYEVAMADGRCVVISPDTRIEPVIAVVDDYAGSIPEGHPLRALLTTDMRKRLAVLNAAGSASPQTGLASVAAPSASSRGALQASIERAERKWGRSSGANGGARLQSSEGLGSAHPPFVVSFIYEWGQKKLTHWNQSSRGGEPCYNYYTPNNWPCGCVATAGAALLQYYGVTAAPKNVTTQCSVGGVARTLTTKGVDYDWSILPSSINSSTQLTEAQRELLGRVTYDVGVCLEMAYGSSGSSASSYDLTYVLRNRFGFKDARYVHSITAAHYEKLIYSQLRCGAPVVLSISYVDGQGKRYGHCVLGVGYGEDADQVPYTRVFMGWGGTADAWYALPDVEDYSTLDNVVTMIGTSSSTMPVYGRVTTDEGFGAAMEKVRASYYSLSTGAFGHWGMRMAPSVSTKTVTFNSQTRTFSVGSAVTTDTIVYTGSTLVGALPAPIDFTNVSAASALRMYSSPEEAQAVALRDGKLMFVLSGANWCGYCSIVKNYLKSLGANFTDRYVLYYCNIDCDNAGMANGAPAYGVFDPRVFKLENRWATSNGRLAYNSGGVEERVQGVLDEAWTAWTSQNRAVASARLQGPDILGEPTGYSLVIDHADGVSREIGEGVAWTRTAGSAAAFSEGLLTPVAGASGNVSFCGSCRYWGATRTASKTVEVVLPLEIRPTAMTAGKCGENYSLQLSASGGKGPYSWSVSGSMDYFEIRGASGSPAGGEAQGWQADDRCWAVALPFDFNFYGTTYRTAYVSSNGTISFGSSFNGNSESVDMLKTKAMIAVLWDDLKTTGGNVYVETAAEAVTIRWQGSYYYGGSAVDFSAKLSNDGKIELRYGVGNSQGGLIGVSAGDGERYLVSEYSQSGSMNGFGTLEFGPSLPSGLELLSDGRIAGTPEKSGVYNVQIMVTDSYGFSKAVDYELEVLAKVEFRIGDHATRTGGGALVQYVHDGEAATAPVLGMRDGWDFYGWDGDFSSVSGQIVVNAICSDVPISFVDFDLGEHGVRVWEGTLHQVVTNGHAAVAPSLVAEEGYRHVGWSADFGNIQGNMTLQALYQPLQVGEVFTAECGGYTWMVTNVSATVAAILGATPHLAGSVSIPEYLQGVMVKRIEESAFKGNDTLVELVVPDAISQVGKYAFRQCSALRKARLLGGGSYGWYAFYDCAQLGDVFVGPGVSYLAYMSFANCTSLSNMVFSAQTAGVDLQTPFDNNPSLRELHLPAKTRPASGNPFANCAALTNVTMDAGGAYKMDGNFMLSANGETMLGALASVRKLTVPDTVTTIGYRSTEGCSLLEELVLPDSVTTLSSQSIYACPSLRTLRLGSGVQTMSATGPGYPVFSSCPNLACVYFAGNAPTNITEFIYLNTSEAMVTYVQPGSTGWNGAGVGGLPDQWPLAGSYRRAILYAPPEITTEVLPSGIAGNAYRFEFQATGGVQPYVWSLVAPVDYRESEGLGQFREDGSAMGWKSDDNCWSLSLPFEFPFFGNVYRTAYVSSNGTISFGSPFSGYSESVETLKKQAMIAVLWDDLKTSQGDIYIGSSADAVTIRWNGTCYSGGGAVNFSATLKRGGEIVLDYGNGNRLGGLIGISAGDRVNYLVSGRSQSGSMENARSVVFSSQPLLEGLSISENGVLSCTPASVGEYEFDVFVGGAQCGTSSRHFVLNVVSSDNVAVDPDAAFWRRYPELLAAGGGNAAMAKLLPSPGRNGQGKLKPNGEAMLVWEDFVAGTDPNSDDQLRAMIEMVGGAPVITWEPALNGKGVKNGVRKYTVLGAKRLDGAWNPVAGGEEAQYNYFKVRVGMP